MFRERLVVVLASNRRVRETYPEAEDIERLNAFADWQWIEFEGGGLYEVNRSPEDRARISEHLGEADALIVCQGAPRIDAEVMDRAPRLKFIGEMEGDRFAGRIEVEAAWRRGLRVVDTTNGSSYPVAEWALALLIISMRKGGELFRRIISGDTGRLPEGHLRHCQGDLFGKRVGLIGCGHIGRRLIKFLRPFETEIWVHDPYLPSEMADALGFLRTSLANVLSQCHAVVCVAPLTPRTKGMIGRAELDLIPSGSVLVNVSRGAIIDSAALIERLRRGDIVAGLDVFDPEPIPADSEIIELKNVFLSPHIAAFTAETRKRFFKLMVDELERFRAGHETYFDLNPRSLANRRGEPES